MHYFLVHNPPNLFSAKIDPWICVRCLLREGHGAEKIGARRQGTEIL